MRFERLLMSVIVTWVVSACASNKDKGDVKGTGRAESTAPQLVGRIASIPHDQKFVLIQSYGPWKIQSGTILTTRGPEQRTANLLVTGESLGQFAAADLQSGLVEVGDAVYSRHVPKPPPPSDAYVAPSEPTQNQQNATSGTVQKNN